MYIFYTTNDTPPFGDVDSCYAVLQNGLITTRLSLSPLKEIIHQLFILVYMQVQVEKNYGLTGLRQECLNRPDKLFGKGRRNAEYTEFLTAS